MWCLFITFYVLLELLLACLLQIQARYSTRRLDVGFRHDSARLSLPSLFPVALGKFPLPMQFPVHICGSSRYGARKDVSIIFDNYVIRQKTH